jgi:hypothetical protein
MKLEEKAIISDRRRSSQLRRIFACVTGHRWPQAVSTFQFCMDIEAITIPDDSEKVWFATDLAILDIGLLLAG